MKKAIDVAIVIITVIVLCGCTISINKSDSGKTVKQTYDIKDFACVMLNCDAEVTITQSDTFSVTAVGTQEQLETLGFDCDSVGILHINRGTRLKKEDNKIQINMNDSGFRVFITTPKLESVDVCGSGSVLINPVGLDNDLRLTIWGSGEIKGDNLHAKSITTIVKGSGDISLGTICTHSYHASIKGSGDIKVTCEAIPDLTFDINGSGDIEARLNDCGTVAAEVSGSGDIELSGNAKSITKKVDGSGDIEVSNLKINK